METTTPPDQQAFIELVAEITSSLSAARQSVQKMANEQDHDTKDGISLLSIKYHIQMSYLQSLVLLSAHRVLGHALSDRNAPSEPFSSSSRDERGANAGDVVDSMIENRIVLEKIKALESKMRYQIEKLVRLANETPASAGDVMDDPLAFKPNPQALMNQDSSDSEDEDELDDEPAREDRNTGTEIYRPPRLAPMPYNDPARGKSKTERRGPIPIALTHLSALARNPHLESTTGTGAAPPAFQSARAKELVRITEFEEENFTRLVMKKSDARRRRRDEEDIALGGTGASAAHRGRRAGAGLEDEFADVLRAVDKRRDSKVGDGYEALRQRGRKEDVLVRSRKRREEDVDREEPRERKKGRFEKSRLALKKKGKGRK